MKVDIYELNDDNVANVIEYDAEKAEVYYKEKERKFMKTCLPKEIKRINRWFNSNPKTKHDTIVEKLLKDYKAKLKESRFFSYYVITQDDIDDLQGTADFLYETGKASTQVTVKDFVNDTFVNDETVKAYLNGEK